MKTEKTIAEIILNEKSSRVGIDLYMYLISVAEKESESKDQDWDAETTTYFFEDGSYITDRNGDLSSGGVR